VNERPQIVRPAAYVLVTRDTSLLLARLCPPEPWTDWWTLPGGGLDFGESPVDAAIREAMEETGLAVEIGDLIEVQSEVFDFPERDMHAIRFIYGVSSWQGEPRFETGGSTDCCAFIPFEALGNNYRHPEYGEIKMVPLARRGMELAAGA
jgi:8-oxo-dGTP diphosphatase